jgi:serine protease 16
MIRIPEMDEGFKELERTFWIGHPNCVVRFFLFVAALVGFAFTSCNSGDSQTESPKVHTRWYSKQRLDHFSETEARVWSQRFFVNESYFDGTGPVFLCVGGEGPELTQDVVVTGTVHCGVMVSLAKEVGALILALEHRYYGESHPLPDLSLENMKWLSSRQALADIAQFHSYILETYGLSEQNRWIAFGGSYPGMLAGWVRMKYPSKVHAAVASSAPVQARVNMKGYNDIIAQSLQAEIVGGSAACAEQTREAFAAVGLNLKSATGRQFLYDLFDICIPSVDTDPLIDEENRFQFLNTLAACFPVEMNDPNCHQSACSIEKVCRDYMVNDRLGQPIDRLAELLISNSAGKCTSVDYQTNTLAPLLDLDYTPDGLRAWRYQIHCKEFGFFRTCDPGTECVFTKDPHVNNVERDFDQCERVFGIDAAEIELAVAETNAYYGGWNPSGTTRALG